MDINELRNRIKDISKTLKYDPESSEQKSHARSALLHRKKLLESKLDSLIRKEWKKSYDELSPIKEMSTELSPSFAISNAINIFYKLAKKYS